MKIKLSDIVDTIGMQFDDAEYYLNLQTGKVTFIQEEEFYYAEENIPFDETPE